VSAEPSEAPPPLGARLSPFVFPSDTTFRFLLLLVAVVGANLYIWNWLHTVLALDPDAAISAYRSCVLAYETVTAGDPDPSTLEAARIARTACTEGVTSALPRWMIGGTVLLLVVAAVIMFLHPRWIVRRRDLRPLERQDAPEVVDELSALAKESGLREEPRWLWNPLDPSPTGLAFGRPGSHAIALMGGLVTRRFADPAAFRAVVRHELAHLRNRDVDLTYATVSLWYAFLLVGLVPFVITIVDQGSSFFFSLAWRVLALAILVYLTRNAVLRAREVYADVRASVPDGPQGALRRILGGLPTGPASFGRRLLRVHPDPGVRLERVNDTRKLFPLGLVVTFGVGVAATIAYESVFDLIARFASDPITINLLAAAVFAPLVMGAIGVGVWRGAWGALAEDARPRATWPFALALAAGLLVGPELALDRVVRPEGSLLRDALGAGAVWILVLVVGLVLLLAWVGASAEAWLRAPAGASRPTVPTVAGLLFASGMLAIFIGVFFALYDTRPVIAKSRSDTAIEHAEVMQVAWVGPVWLYKLVRDPYVMIVVTKPVVFLAIVALWLFPFLAWLRRRDRAVDAPWAFLEPGGRLRIPLLGRGSLDPWKVGCVAGLACLGAFLVQRLALKAGYDADTRLQLQFSAAFFYWQLLLGLATQGAAAIVATARAQANGLALIAGLAAAFVAGVIATAGLVIGPTIAGCFDPIALGPLSCGWHAEREFSWLVLRLLIAQGAVVALAGGLVVLGVRALVARRNTPVPATAESTPS
jgi:Zn-dependent protease with chaperone function